MVQFFFFKYKYKYIYIYIKYLSIKSFYYPWFRSHLNNRKQKVYINGVMSDRYKISSEVPQGSLLGPILFKIFVNDFSRLNRLTRYLTSKSLVSVYSSLIYHFLYYGCLLCGNNYDAPLSKVVKLQNKSVRIINDVRFMKPITPHYVAPRLLKLPDIVKLSMCLLFYEYFNDDRVFFLISSKPSLIPVKFFGKWNRFVKMVNAIL